MNQNNREYKDR